MSSIARWSYANTATVEPLTGRDHFNGGATYGAPYVIACSWTAKTETRRDKDGAEYITRNIIYTEDKRPQIGDRITLNGQTVAEEIRDRVEYDMSPFGEPDSPDFELVT